MEAGYVPIGNMHACKRSERKCQYGQQTAALAERATSVRSRISVHELASFFLPLNTKHVNFSQLASALWASFFHAPFRMH